jgi:fucose permease
MSVVLVSMAIGLFIAFPAFQGRPHAYVITVLLLFAAGVGVWRVLEKMAGPIEVRVLKILAAFFANAAASIEAVLGKKTRLR